jgi:hypothetical protein
MREIDAPVLLSSVWEWERTKLLGCATTSLNSVCRLRPLSSVSLLELTPPRRTAIQTKQCNHTMQPNSNRDVSLQPPNKLQLDFNELLCFALYDNGTERVERTLRVEGMPSHRLDKLYVL